MFQSIPQTQEKIGKLARYLEAQKDGDELTFVQIEQETGITMGVRTAGRDLLRRALRKVARPYEAIRATGIRLSAPTTAMTVLRGRVVRIDGAVRVAARTQRQLQERHLEQMSSDDQRKMLMAAGFFGAIRALARENSGKLFK